jgi:hypothetical protein
MSLNAQLLTLSDGVVWIREYLILYVLQPVSYTVMDIIGHVAHSL